MSLLSELGTITFDRPVIAAMLTPRRGEPFSVDQWIDNVPDIFKPAAIYALERVLPNFDVAPASPEDIHKMAAFIALEIRTLVDTRALTREGFEGSEEVEINAD